MSLIAAPFATLTILYAGGFLAQLLGNYATWKQGGGIPGDGTSPLAASPDFLLCLSSVLRPPYGVYGILICIGLLQPVQAGQRHSAKRRDYRSGQPPAGIPV